MNVQLPLLICFLLISCTRVHAQSYIPIDDAIGIIEYFEEGLGHYEYELRQYSTSARERNGEWSITPPPAASLPRFGKTEVGVYSGRFIVAVEPADLRFRVEFNTAYKSVFKSANNKKNVYVIDQANEKVAFDGSEVRYQWSAKRYKDQPVRLNENGDAVWDSEPEFEFKGGGVIARWEGRENYLAAKHLLDTIGVLGCMGWTLVEDPELLSKFLRNKLAAGEKVTAREMPQGLLEIYCSIQKTFDVPYAVKFFYDTGHGRIERIEWGNCVKCPDQSPENWFTNRIALYKYDDSTVLPTEFGVIELPLPKKKYTPGMTCKAQLYRLTKRRFLPKKKEGSFFTFDFDPGARVTDYVREKEYVAGQGLEDDVSATRAFMESHNLVRPGKVERRTLSWWLWGSIFAIVATGTLFWVRKRWWVLLVLCSVWSWGSASNALASEPQEQPAETEAKTSVVHTRQCGQIVTAATCAYFKKDVDARILAAVMQPTASGTSLLQIKHALQLHGLRAEGMKCKSVRSLKALVTPGRVAVVPFILPGGRGHFGLVVRQEEGTAPLLVDPPNAVAPIEDTMLTDRSLADVGGIVLLVSEDAARHSPRVQPTKSVVDLGDIITDDPSSDIIDFDIELRNDSDVPAFVTFRTSCGCIQAREPAIVIDPRGKRRASFFVGRGGWGLGEYTRYVEVISPDSSTQPIAIRGRGLRQATADHGLSFSTNTIMIEAKPYDRVETMNFPQTTLTVTGLRERLENMEISSNASWVHAAPISDIRNEFEETCKVTVGVRVEPNSELFDALKSPARQVTTEIRFSTSEGRAPTAVQVALVRPACVQWSTGNISMSGSEHQCEISFTSKLTGDGSGIRRVSMLTQSDELKAEPTDECNRLILRWPTGPTSRPPGLIRFRVQAEWGEEAILVPFAQLAEQR